MNLSQLSRAYAAKGDLHGAKQYAQSCVDLNQQTGSAEGTAAGLHALGHVALAEGDYDSSLPLLTDSHDAFQGLDQPAGIAGTAIDLAELKVATMQLLEAEEHLEIARLALTDSPHYAIMKEYERVLRMVQDKR